MMNCIFDTVEKKLVEKVLLQVRELSRNLKNVGEFDKQSHVSKFVMLIFLQVLNAYDWSVRNILQL